MGLSLGWAWKGWNVYKYHMYMYIYIYIVSYRYVSCYLISFERCDRCGCWTLVMFVGWNPQLLWVLEGKSHQGPQPCKLQKPTKAIMKLSGTLCTCGAANYSASCSEVPAAPVASHFGANWACWDVSRYIQNSPLRVVCANERLQQSFSPHGAGPKFTNEKE